ncbi:phosphomevalonate kinase [Angomonas deanei]|nr:phosphomevalonate kinase [Angomonas deanei]|eukprot:EPY36026.1 phosphomevalonate kinase [Angomonas deanei]
MTTSVVACIFSFYHGITEEQEFIHRIAQVAHSVAQGKIGSGFDVYTAVYGTCAYRRFPAEKVEAMMKEATDLHTVPVADLQACVDLKENWVTHVPFHLPSGIKLVLGDVHQGGSSTPGMVAKIMNWQKENAASKDNLWEQLRVNNEAYISSLQSLIQHSADGPEAYNAAVEKLSHVSRIESYKGADRFEESIVEACQFAANSRRLLREMGVAAGVKVEPEELTELLNDTAELPGVFAVGCPGAGGYDAVFALVLGDKNCEAVEKFWEGYSKMNVCPLTVREDPGGLLISKI